MLFNVTLAVIAGFTADAASVPYLSGCHPTQGCGCALLWRGHRLATDSHLSILFSPQLSDSLSDLSVHHFVHCMFGLFIVMP